MPNYLRNWTFGDVVSFLEQHYFKLRNVIGSHYYYRGFVDGKDVLCHVQRHPNETIHPKTLKSDIIRKSGIPLDVWQKWGMSGGKSKQKDIQYPGAKPF